MPATPFSAWSWRWAEPPEVDVDGERNRRMMMRAIALELSSAGERLVGEMRKIDLDYFHAIVEGRNVGNPRYSGCGDLAGACLGLLGVRDERIVNRNDDNFDGVPDVKQSAKGLPWWDEVGSKPWRVGWNLVLLRDGAARTDCWVRATSGRLPRQGDVFLVDYGTGMDHVGVMAADPVEVDPGSVWYVDATVEGGQVNEGGQCVKKYKGWIVRKGSSLRLARDRKATGRLLDGWIDVARVPLATPALVPPGCDWGVPAPLMVR